MRLKPRSTMLNPRALLYKRYTQVQSSVTASQNGNTVYRTVDNKYWAFDYASKSFIEIDPETYGITTSIVINDSYCIKYTDTTILNKSYYYQYNRRNGWKMFDTQPSGVPETVGTLKSSTIGNYQINNYYYSGSFDYSIKGSITGNTIQRLRGNIIPVKSLDIKYYNDYVVVEPDDLIVIEKQLFAVESVEQEHKHNPRDFTIYYATLNSIL